MDSREYITNTKGINRLDTFNNYNYDFIQNKVYIDNKGKESEAIKNDILNLTLKDVYNNIINLVPNLYKDYNKEYLNISLNLKTEDKYVSENVIVRQTIMFMIFNNKNMIYVGIVLLFIVFFLYIIKI